MEHVDILADDTCLSNSLPALHLVVMWLWSKYGNNYVDITVRFSLIPSPHTRAWERGYVGFSNLYRLHSKDERIEKINPTLWKRMWDANNEPYEAVTS